MADKSVSEKYGSLINTNALIDINNTTYYIQEDWFETIRKYFNIASDDEESINMLKSGLFGFNTEIFSNEIKNNVYHRNIIYDEHFLNTASFPESLYNFAKMYNYNIEFARPSHCRINFAITKEDLVNNKFREEVDVETGSITTKRVTYKLVIDNSYIFLLDNVQFKLPYPVIVNFKETADKSDFTLTAYYDTSESNFPYLTLSTDYIKLWQDYDDGKKVVYFGLDLYQLTYKEKEIQINSEDISDNLYYDVTFDNQLAFFEVFYVYNGESYRLHTYFNNTYQPDSGERFCYYTIIDNNQIQISFSSTSGSFRPALNSTLLIKIYTTIGEKGNFSYIGHKISVNFNNHGEFDKVPVSIIPITDCSGGRNLPNYTQTKNGIIDKFSVRNSLIIENDLENHFNTINETEQVNGSSLTWIKKRNDIIKRLFTAYLLVKDTDHKVIPTNTAPTLLVSSDYLKASHFSLKENTKIYYDEVVDAYRISDDGKPNKAMELTYRFPFLLNVQSDPILVGNYFSTYIDDNVNMVFQYINPHIDDNFSLKELTIYKDNIKSTKYTISVDMNSSYHSVSKDYIVVRCAVCDSTGKPYGFIELDPQKNKEDTIINKFYFEGYLDVNQASPIINNKIVISELYSINGGAKPGDIITDVQLPSDITLQLAIFIKSSESNYKSGIFNTMTDVRDYCTALIYESENTLELFKNLYRYMESDVRTPNEMKKKLTPEEYKKLYGDKNYYFIKQVPLIEDEYFENCHKVFFNTFNSCIEVARESIDYLENITDVDVKLVNTYGKSRFYYYDFTYDEDGNIIYDYIDNIHLNIEMKVYLNYYIDEETDLAIKTYVSDFVESCNNSRIFPISNLITRLETNFDIISYIEFFTIGGDNTQKIKSTFTSLLNMTEEEIENYVPEFLNIQKKLDMSQKRYKEIVDDTTGQKVQVEDEDYNKTLTYPYNYNINITYMYS